MNSRAGQHTGALPVDLSLVSRQHHQNSTTRKKYGPFLCHYSCMSKCAAQNGRSFSQGQVDKNSVRSPVELIISEEDVCAVVCDRLVDDVLALIIERSDLRHITISSKPGIHHSQFQYLTCIFQHRMIQQFQLSTSHTSV